MLERRSLRRWLFFLGVTVTLALPLAAGYYYLGHSLQQAELRHHQTRVDNQLNQWQEQLYDIKWDGLADTFDDTLHLANYDPGQLLQDTLRWYVYPDGHTFIEGLAVLDPEGRLTAHRAAAVYADDGAPLDPAVRQRLETAQPWLASPWLADYTFVAQAFQADPELEFYLSPIVDAPGRKVLVMASARRDAAGKLISLVAMQISLAQIYSDIIGPGATGLSLWLMDQKGQVGLATSELAAASARRFLARGGLAPALAAGEEQAEASRMGAAGRLEQDLPQGPAQLNYRTMEGNLVLGVVETTASLGAIGRRALESSGAISLMSLLLLAAAGAIYTLAAVKREARTVEKVTLERYAGTVSHRFRNSLSALEGNLELILAGRVQDPAKVQDLLHTCLERDVRAIEHTVEDLERLGRGELNLVYEGQAGQETLYRLSDPRKEEGHEPDPGSG
ncbi:MAG: hypothetical protein KQJ78_13930 [Deltaproteobacteria bacterium]|nr:hypothetical protein [Deltaproteobacteria bacterium]